MNDPAAVVPLESWEGKPVSEWAALWGVPRVLAYAATESTNDVARELAQAGTPAGTLVLADHQTRGRGRQGRTWHAPPGKALLLSMVLRPGLRTGDATPGVVSVRVGLAAARALESAAGVHIGLKWPNDLVADDAKLGGILLEGVMGEDDFQVVAGIGLNVLQRPGEFPADLDGPAVSLAMVAAAPVSRSVLAGALAGALAPLATSPAIPLSGAELREFAGRDILGGQAIAIDGTPVGRARGLEPDGALRVERADGSIVSYRGGTVRLASGTNRDLP